MTTDVWTDGDGVGAKTGESVTNSPSTGSGSGTTAAPVCTYQKLVGDDAATAQDFSESGYGPAKGADPGSWYRKICIDAAGQSTGLITWLVDQVDPEAVARQALDYARLDAPQITMSPRVDQVQLVNLPTWLAVPAASWVPVVAAATVGGVTATTTATPVQVAWNMGDGNTRVCNGPGATYDPSRDDAQQSSDCTYTYRSSSARQPNHAYLVTAAQRWHITWTAMGVPAGVAAAGDLGTIDRNATVSLRVGEIQTVN